VATSHNTAYKRFALWAHSNFFFAKTSFMLGTLSEIGLRGGMKNIKNRRDTG